jgi:hypothetical protein
MDAKASSQEIPHYQRGEGKWDDVIIVEVKTRRFSKL